MVELGEKDQGCKMISGLKNTQKLVSLCYKKLSMSKKSSSVNLKNGFKEFKNLSKIFSNFKKKLNLTHKKKFVVAVSGGPDSLALAALSKAYTYCYK